jgi:hypothetical protein
MAKNIAVTFGVVLGLVGLLGLLGGFGIVGENGLFATDTVHDLIHLVSGIVFLLVGFNAPAKSSATLITFGVIYGLVTVLGFASEDHVLGILMNDADDYLHLAITAVALIAGFSTKNG